MTTAKKIFDKIQGLNPNINSYGFVDSYCQQAADFIFSEVIKYIHAGTLAEKIMTSGVRQFTEKQLWVIAFELLKNADYVSALENPAHDYAAAKAANKLAESKAKLAANKDASADVLAEIKAAGKKLTEYYKWLNNAKNQYRKEFFNKKYSAESVQLFISL